MFDVGDYVPECGNDSRIQRAHDSPYSKLGGHSDAVQTCPASIGDEGEVARVEPAPY